MKEVNEQEKKDEENLIKGEEKKEKVINQKEEVTDDSNRIEELISKTQSEQDKIDDLKSKEKEKKRKEIRNSYCYNIKDYIFFFSLMISSSMNFSYLYFPLTLIGVIQYYNNQNKKIMGLPENGVHQKHLKLGYLSLFYSIFLLIFKIICLYLVKNDNTYIFRFGYMLFKRH